MNTHDIELLEGSKAKEILSLVDTLIASVNGAHQAKSNEWRDGCFHAADETYQKIKTELAALEADRKRRGEPVAWQPIETAPKDGTTILVWFRQHGAMTVCWGDRDYNHTSEYAIWLVDDHKHGPYPVRGYSRGDDTHWMPLPPAPQPADPVKMPSDDDLLALIREHAFRQYEFDDLLAFARDLLARYTTTKVQP